MMSSEACERSENPVMYSNDTTIGYMRTIPFALYHAVTVKPVSKECIRKVTKDILLQYVMDKLPEMTELDEHCFEQDSKGVLHIHCLTAGPWKLNRKQLSSSGYTVDVQHLKQEFNVRSWRDYLNKYQYDNYLFDQELDAE